MKCGECFYIALNNMVRLPECCTDRKCSEGRSLLTRAVETSLRKGHDGSATLQCFGASVAKGDDESHDNWLDFVWKWTRAIYMYVPAPIFAEGFLVLGYSRQPRLFSIQDRMHATRPALSDRSNLDLREGHWLRRCPRKSCSSAFCKSRNSFLPWLLPLWGDKSCCISENKH